MNKTSIDFSTIKPYLTPLNLLFGAAIASPVLGYEINKRLKQKTKKEELNEFSPQKVMAKASEAIDAALGGQLAHDEMKKTSPDLAMDGLDTLKGLMSKAKKRSSKEQVTTGSPSLAFKNIV
jgi:hypothetical protein